MKNFENVRIEIESALWPSWATLERLEVSLEEDGSLLVKAFRDSEWVPVGVTSGMPEQARQNLLILAEIGANNPESLPEWTYGSSEAWKAFEEALKDKDPEDV